MSTYDGAYSSRNYSSEPAEPKKRNEKYKVLKSTHVNTYNYHGSWSEYTWNLTLEDEKGNVTTRHLDTWKFYDSLTNATIEYDGSTFEKI